MPETTAVWRDLSDDELRARLVQHAARYLKPETIDRIVAERDSDLGAEEIDEILG